MENDESDQAGIDQPAADTDPLRSSVTRRGASLAVSTPMEVADAPHVPASLLTVLQIVLPEGTYNAALGAMDGADGVEGAPFLVADADVRVSEANGIATIAWESDGVAGELTLELPDPSGIHDLIHALKAAKQQ